MMPDAGGAHDFREYLVAIRRRKWIVIVTLLVTAVAALILSSRREPVYEGKARVLVSQNSGLSLSGGQGGSVDPAVVQTQAEVIQSGPVKAAVRSRLGQAPKVAVTPVGDTAVIEIKAKNRLPRRAADTANAYAQAYVDFRSQNATDRLNAAIQGFERRSTELRATVDSLADQLRNLPPCAPTRPGDCARREEVQRQRDDLLAQQIPIQQRLDQLRVEASVGDPGVQVIAAADVPRSPVSPKPVRDGIIGACLGLLVGLVLALVYDRFHEGLNTAEDLERCLPGVPVLGVIPSVRDWRRHRVVLATRSDLAAAHEAFRRLRTSILHLGLVRPLRIIQITSAGASEGKTAVVTNLAQSIVETGKRVLVVDGDLRRPQVHSWFDVPNDVGLTSVLVGHVPLHRAIRPAGGSDELSVLPAGPTPPNPSELLASGAMLELVEGLAARDGTLIVDSPPVLPVTDAVVLSEIVDGTVLVVMAGQTTRKSLTRAAGLLRQMDAPLIGMVLNAAGPQETYGQRDEYYSISRDRTPPVDTTRSPRRRRRALRKTPREPLVDAADGRGAAQNGSSDEGESPAPSVTPPAGRPTEH